MDKKVILQRLGILLAYPLAYSYIRFVCDDADNFIIDPSNGSGHFLIAFSFPLFALLFIAVNEIVRRSRRENATLNRETVFWYLMTFLTGLTARFGPGLELSVFAMHLCAVYSVLVSNGILLGGKTSGFIFADLIDGIYVKSFAGFPNYVVDWKCFGRPDSETDPSMEDKRTRVHIGSLAFITIMIVLMIISVSLMASIDEDIAVFIDNAFDGVLRYFDTIDAVEIFIRIVFAIPVCFYLYGLISRTAKSDGEREHRVASWLSRILGKGKTVSATIVYVAAGIFVLAYILFFVKRLTYMMGGFVGNVPDDMLVSHYAREGFFELVGIMAVNSCVYLAIILFGKSDENGKFAVPAKILVTLLMLESIIFAVIAMSKLGLYYSIYGYTPKRILAMWGTLALGFAAGLTIVTVHRGKPHFRAGVIFTSVSYIAICILSAVLVAIGA